MTKPFSSHNSMSQQEKKILLYIYDHTTGDHSFTRDNVKRVVKNNQLMRKWEGRGWVVKKQIINQIWMWKLTDKAVNHIKAYRDGVDVVRNNMSYG